MTFVQGDPLPANGMKIPGTGKYAGFVDTSRQSSGEIETKVGPRVSRGAKPTGGRIDKSRLPAVKHRLTREPVEVDPDTRKYRRELQRLEKELRANLRTLSKAQRLAIGSEMRRLAAKPGVTPHTLLKLADPDYKLKVAAKAMAAAGSVHAESGTGLIREQ